MDDERPGDQRHDGPENWAVGHERTSPVLRAGEGCVSFVSAGSRPIWLPSAGPLLSASLGGDRRPRYRPLRPVTETAQRGTRLKPKSLTPVTVRGRCRLFGRISNVGSCTEPPVAFDEFAADHNQLFAMLVVDVFIGPLSSRLHVDDPDACAISRRQIPPEAARSDLDGRNVIRLNRIEHRGERHFSNTVAAPTRSKVRFTDRSPAGRVRWSAPAGTVTNWPGRTTTCPIGKFDDQLAVDAVEGLVRIRMPVPGKLLGHHAHAKYHDRSLRRATHCDRRR